MTSFSGTAVFILIVSKRDGAASGMSVDKLRRALLAQRQRIDGAQQQEMTASAPSTSSALQPASKRIKRKAQTQKVEEREHDEMPRARSKTLTSIRSPSSAAVATPHVNQQPPSSHKKHRPSQFTTASPNLPQPHSSLSRVSSLSPKLASSRFRWLNEQLYTLPSSAAFAHFSAHPGDYEAYHTGFRQQVQRWPSHPLDIIIAHLQSLSTSHTIADMGCGDARIAHTLAGTQHTVHSFDLVPASALVTQCNIRHTPLATHSVDTLVYCLSLMPTDYHALLTEGLRILRPGGEMIVAEVSSRLVEGGGVDGFVRGLEAMGVKRRKVVDNDYFALVWCQKDQQPSKAEPTGAARKKGKASGSGGGKKPERGKVVLTPCIYKKR